MTKRDVVEGMQSCVWCRGGSTCSDTPLPEYLAVDGCSRASVIRHALIAHEPLFVDDFPAFVNRVLLVDVERCNPASLGMTREYP